MKPTLEQMISFARAQEAEARKWAKHRRESAEDWRSQSDADARMGAAAATAQTGTRHKVIGRAERQDIATREDRIALKYDADAIMYESIALALEAAR